MSNLSLENLEYLASLKALLKLNDLTREQSQMSSRLLGKTNPMTIGSSIFVPATQGFVPSSPFRRALAVPPVLRNLNVTPSVAQVAEAIQRLQPTLPSTSEGTSIRNHFSPPKLRQEYPKSSTRLLHPRFVNAYNLAQPLPSKGLPSPLPHPVAPAPESSVSSAIETKKIPERNVSEHSERVTPPLESGDPDIRVDKVQAALRSKHQRGKKRSDLNHMERLELTRTRNREHAKSTRLRKKARYEELVLCEEQLNSLLKSKNLQKERLQCFQQFLSARQDMLNSVNVSAHQSHEKSYRNCTLSLNGIINDPVRFRFLVRDGADTDNDFTSSISRMRSWDQQLRLRIFEPEVDAFPSPSTPTGSPLEHACKESATVSSSSIFSYEIEDGTEGFAVSDNGIGYAHVDLVLYKTMEKHSSRSPTQASRRNRSVSDPSIGYRPSVSSWTRERSVLMTLALRVRFEDAPSNRLSSVSWTVLRDCLVSRGKEQPRRRSCSPSLIARAPVAIPAAFPSVVSLCDHSQKRA